MRKKEKLFDPKAIFLDMDGTIADLYGVPDWLNLLRSYDPSPYIQARPLVDMEQLKKKLEELQSQGYHIGVVSWLSKESTIEYKKAVRAAKMGWLENFFGKKFFDEIHIVAYGTPKHRIVSRMGTLVDDDYRIREEWQRNGGTTINPQLIDILAAI